MKQALVGDQLVIAAAGAPARAVCPHCEGVVELRERQGTYFWRHVALPRGGCRPQEMAGDGAAAGNPEQWVRRVGDFVIELCPGGEGAGGPCIRLRNLSAEALRPGSGQALRQGSGQALRQGSGQALRQGSGQAAEVVICPSEVRALVGALMEAAAELVGWVVGDWRLEIRD